MLTGIQIYNVGGKLVLTLPVAKPNRNSSYVVKDIEGLGPVKADISISEYAIHDGGTLQAAKLGVRNIVMNIGYRPNYKADQNVQNLRRELYSYFPPKGFVKIRFIDSDLPPMETTGYVETHESVIFSRDPEVQISILCPDSHLKAISRTYLTGFSNSAVHPAEAVTAETDFIFELYANRIITSVTLQNGIDPNIVFTGLLESGDTLRISTAKGNKYVRILRRGSTINALDGLTSGSLSMIVDSRVLSFKALVPGLDDIPYRVSMLPKFLGV